MNNLISTGKQILNSSGKHVADCASVEVAELIVKAVNERGELLELTKDYLMAHDWDKQGAFDLLNLAYKYHFYNNYNMADVTLRIEDQLAKAIKKAESNA